MATPYADNPFLKGNFAPIRMECDAPDLIIKGEIPKDLNGALYRIGPDPQFAPVGSHHWFGGDGMVHMFRVENGRVAYRNRYVRTKKFELEREAGKALVNYFDPMNSDPSVPVFGLDGLANTNIVWHGGKLLALEEGHLPFELDSASLDSLGVWSFDGGYEGPMTAHPKFDPETGEMLFFGYMAGGPFSDDMTFQIVDKHGTLTRSDRFKAPFPSMVHDFIATDRDVIFPIFPITGSLERAMKGDNPFLWEPDKGTHIGVLPRDADIDQMRWFDMDPAYVFHPMNAWRDGDVIRAHVMQFRTMSLDFSDGVGDGARLAEWEIDLGSNSGEVKWKFLDDLQGEFPRIDDRRTGLAHRHGYYAASQVGGLGFDTLVHQDFKRDARTDYRLPQGDSTSEPVFVPRSATSEEGDGYLVSVIYRAAENRSDMAFFDATSIDAGPIALAELSTRVPNGFHGNWRSLD
ncbi:MAG: carotenoid oxygenase family protein [Gammaproteobacteria bacterium]|nr:carotenoid oxygenase family protein [Gammaproteobacteria bacterium]